MATTEITAHIVAKNEDIFLWYSIASIINYVDKVIIFDTGSTDKTVQIIKSFKSSKIEFEEKGDVDARELVSLRQEQIEKTKTNWFWVVDGDEVYPKSTAKEVIDFVNKDKNKYEGGVVRRYDLLGDIYHYQSEEVGEYNLFGLKGHLVLRLINKSKFPGLYLKGEYPNEGYYDQNGIALINHPVNNFFITSKRLFHAMYLKRSTLGEELPSTLHRKKFKIETGLAFPATTNFPNVFFQKKPPIVPDVISPRNSVYNIMATLLTPVKKVKRMIWKRSL